MEEHILGLFFSAEELHIVNDEDIHHLVEMTEVIHRVVAHSINELVGEALRADVQDGLVWLAVLDFQADGVGQVRFPETDPAINQEGVECRATRLVGHGKSCASCQTVALTFDEFLEGVVGVQVGVDVQLPQSRNHEWILDWGRFAYDGHGHLRISCRTDFGGGHVHCVRAGGASMDLLHDDAVFQTGIRTQFFPYGLAEQ